MARPIKRPIKRIEAGPEVFAELRRRARAATSTVRAKERASMVLLRLEGVSVTAAAARHDGQARFDVDQAF